MSYYATRPAQTYSVVDVHTGAIVGTDIAQHLTQADESWTVQRIVGSACDYANASDADLALCLIAHDGSHVRLDYFYRPRVLQPFPLKVMS